MGDDVINNKHIFISYIEEDKDIAEIIWNRLNKENFIPWAYTKNYTYKWKKEVVRELKRSEIVILLISKKANEKADKQISKELELANRFEKKIIPFMVDEIRPEDITNEEIAYEIIGGNITWISKDTSIEKQVDKLLERIKQYYEMNLSGVKKSAKTALFTSLSPTSVIAGQSTTFTVYGSNLPSTIALSLYDGSCGPVFSKSATSAKITCIPNGSGSKPFYIKDKPDGSIISGASGMSVNVIDSKRRKSNLFWIFLLLPIVLLLIGFSNQNYKKLLIGVVNYEKKEDVNESNQTEAIGQDSSPLSESAIENNGTLPIKNDINDTVSPKTKEPASESIASPNDINTTIKSFFESFYRDSQLQSPQSVLKYYSDHVDYFGKTNADKDYILKNSKAYIKKYPKREYNITKVNIETNSNKTIDANITYSWKIANSDGKVKTGNGIQKYILIKNDDNFTIKYVETISRNETKSKIEHTKTDGSKNNFFVCYKNSIIQNGKLTYTQCSQKSKPCDSYSLQYFGIYTSESKSQEALIRCNKGSPRPLYNGTVSVSGNDFLALRTKGDPSADLIKRLYNGDKLGVITQRGKWIMVIAKKSGIKGWVRSKYVKTLESYNAKVYGIKNYLALQEIPSKNANTIAKLHNDDRLVALEERIINNIKWAKVKVSRGNKVGWVHASKIKLAPR